MEMKKKSAVSLQKVMSSGIRREELWVTSKLWNDKHAEEDVIPACRQTLKDLQLEYLDLYLIHWPFPNHHAPGVDVNSRDPHAVPYIHENYMKTWRQMEKLVEMGSGAAYRNVEYDHSKIEIAAARCKDQACRE